MLTILIGCGDLLIAEKIAKNVLRAAGRSTCILYAGTASETLSLIENRRYIPDIMFIEMNLKEYGGSVLEDQIRKQEQLKEAPIIFITRTNCRLIGNSDLSVYQSYKKQNYLSLPLRDIEIQAKTVLYLEQIISQQSKNKSKTSYVFKDSSGYTRLDLDKILFVELTGRDCMIHTGKGGYLLKRTSLNDLQASISSENILRCHRSFLLNVSQLQKIEKIGRKCWLAYFNHNTETCPVSSIYIKDVLSRFYTVFSKQIIPASGNVHEL